ncbi:hypothetical protein [Ruegeria lacuscaerulensis]|nr:hypothetical protein [Ruegeria lacuscaerulensis]
MTSETQTGLLHQLETLLREEQPNLNRYEVSAAAEAFLLNREEM